MSNSENPNIITLCTKNCGCGTPNCPEFERQADGTILIRDDYGQQIRITAEDLQLFVQWAIEGKFNPWLSQLAAVE